MQKLIIVNGPCGVGKTTLAESLHQKMDLSVLVQTDNLRGMVSGCRENLAECSKVSLRLAQSMTETALDLGNSVIYEKILLGPSKYETDYDALEELIKSATDRGAEVKNLSYGLIVK